MIFWGTIHHSTIDRNAINLKIKTTV